MDVPGSRELEAGFERFFGAYSRKLVGLAYVMTGDLAEAQDLAQETLARVWQRWARVSTYDDPAAFARRVLHNLVIGRWRHRRAAPPQERLRHVPPPDVDHLDVLEALAALPVEQRAAVVLHDLVGLNAVEIGHEVGARAGTVRQRLRRGRAALSAALDDELCPPEEG